MNVKLVMEAVKMNALILMAGYEVVRFKKKKKEKRKYVQCPINIVVLGSRAYLLNYKPETQSALYMCLLICILIMIKMIKIFTQDCGKCFSFLV